MPLHLIDSTSNPEWSYFIFAVWLTWSGSADPGVSPRTGHDPIIRMQDRRKNNCLPGARLMQIFNYNAEQMTKIKKTV
jgi:hypothetical protein